LLLEAIFVIDYHKFYNLFHTGLKMKSIFLSLVFALVLSGCASSNKFYTQEGQEVYRIDCSGKHLSWATCDEKAGAICTSKGYAIVGEKHEESGGVLGVRRNMIIKCRD
jgi:uncharacterized protein YceK